MTFYTIEDCESLHPASAPYAVNELDTLHAHSGYSNLELSVTTDLLINAGIQEVRYD